MTNKDKKCVLIGMDSASPRLINKWIDSLPNLKKLMEGGVSGTLRSTVPPISAPAWTSMVTGRNPNKTGVFDWIRKTGGTGKKSTEIVTMASVEEPKIWDILGENGLKSIVMNLPLTYPPMRLNGIMVSGLPGHISGEGITYPSSVKKELDEVTDGYEIYPDTDLRVKDREREYISDFERVLEKRTKAVLHLMEEKEWNFLMCIFYILDSVQHYFWKYMDDQHPDHDPEKAKEWGDVIKKFYIKIDEKIGRIMEKLEPDTDIIVVSDHGMGPLYGKFSMNNFLLKKGFLIPKNELGAASGKEKTQDRVAEKILEYGRKLPRPILSIGKKLIPFEWVESLSVRGRVHREGEEILDLIDEDETKAYALGESGGIFLKDKDSLDELREELQSIQPPIIKNEDYIEIHESKKTEKGEFETPGIFCTIDGYKMKTTLSADNELWSPAELSGYHIRDGVLIISGPSFKKNRLELNNDIYDILPLILSVFDEDIPEELDGEIPKKILK